MFIGIFLFCVKENISSTVELRNIFEKEDAFIGPTSTELLVKPQKRKGDKTRKKFLSKKEISKFSVQKFNGDTGTIARVRIPKELPPHIRTVRAHLFIYDL